MNINWKLRLQNKATLTALAGFVVAFVYQVLGLFGVTAPISQDQVINIIAMVVTLLAGMGIVTDPTTAGVGDSVRAMTYSEPYSTAEAEASKE